MGIPDDMEDQCLSKKRPIAEDADQEKKAKKKVAEPVACAMSSGFLRVVTAAVHAYSQSQAQSLSLSVSLLSLSRVIGRNDEL